jgi:hypothetical protein
MANRVTKAQQAVLDAMADGWELGRSSSAIDTRQRCRLQKGGIGMGGEVRAITLPTLNALLESGLIEPGTDPAFNTAKGARSSRLLSTKVYRRTSVLAKEARPAAVPGLPDQASALASALRTAASALREIEESTGDQIRQFAASKAQAAEQALAKALGTSAAGGRGKA